ncbi:MAG: hypothetical protein ACRDPR_12275 [Nocardioidaceae bacterium]
MVRVLTLVVLLTVALAPVGACTAGDAAGRAGDREADPVAAYETALAPLKRRSDVLEKRFATAQADGADPARIREVLEQVTTAYAGLLERTRAIEVDDPAVETAHESLLAGLEHQQRGLELALRAVETDDTALMEQAGAALAEAQRLMDEHRRLLARAG